jgi:hypothetical protein
MDGWRGWLRGFVEPGSKAAARHRRRREFRIEPLEERILLSGTTTAQAAAAAQAVFSKLTDPGVRQLAQADYAATQSITRNDLLSIFIEVEQDHVVSAAELSSLQTLVANASTVGMPGYVADLAGKVVNGDPANIYLKSAASANGDLYAGCVASQLKVLVNDWFEGGGPIAMTNSSVTLSWVSGVLFAKGGPRDTDIAQGVIGDCTLLASLAEVALRDPQTIESMFINNGDGSVTVRLYDNGVPNYVTVDAQLPDGGTLYDRPVNGVLWAALVEKAIVEENAEGWLKTWYPGSDSYAALNGGDQGTAVAYLSTLTGLPSSYFGVDPSNIIADWNAGKLVVLSTGDSVPSGSGLVADHCYAMTGYNPASSTPISLFNPWGAQASQPSVSLTTLTTSFQFAAAAGSAPPSDSYTTSIANEFSPIAAVEVVASPVPVTTQSVPTSKGSRSTTAPEVVPSEANCDIDQFFANWMSGVA